MEPLAKETDVEASKVMAHFYLVALNYTEKKSKDVSRSSRLLDRN